MADWFLRVERLTTRCALWFAVALLVGSVTLGFYQVLTRFLLNAPSTWSEVTARSLMIWCVFVGAAPAFRGGVMMAVEAVYKLVPRRFHLALETVIALLCALFLVALIWFGTAMAWRVRMQMLAGVEVSIAWVYAALPVGSVFSLLAVAGRYVERVRARAGLAEDESVLVSGETRA